MEENNSNPENIIQFADFILATGPSKLAAIALHVCDLFGPTGAYDSYNIVAALFETLQRLKSIFESSNEKKLETGFSQVYNIGTKLLGCDFYGLKSEDERRLSFEAAMVLLLASRPEGLRTQWSNCQMLLAEYPEFVKVDQFELNLLLNFRNMTAVAALLQPEKLKKGHVLYLITRICEGRHQRYVLGSKATRQTRHRVLIFERERAKALNSNKEALYEKFYLNVAASAKNSLINSETFLDPCLHKHLEL